AGSPGLAGAGRGRGGAVARSGRRRRPQLRRGARGRRPGRGRRGLARPAPDRRVHRGHARRRRRRGRDGGAAHRGGGAPPVTATGRAADGVHGRLLRPGATGRAPRWAVAAALGLLADRALGEPPAPVHPVALFGRAMARLEPLVRGESGSGSGRSSRATAGPVRRSDGSGGSRRHGRVAGAAYAAAGVGLGAAAGSALGPSLPAGAAATWLVVAGRALGEEALAVGERLAAGDLDGARRR